MFLPTIPKLDNQSSHLPNVVKKHQTLLCRVFISHRQIITSWISASNKGRDYCIPSMTTIYTFSCMKEASSSPTVNRQGSYPFPLLKAFKTLSLFKCVLTWMACQIQNERKKFQIIPVVLCIVNPLCIQRLQSTFLTQIFLFVHLIALVCSLFFLPN